MRPALTLFAILTPVIVAANLWAAAESDDDGYILDHKTLYISPKVATAHRFELTGGISGDKGKGKIVVDTNECQLNEFGDRTTCTEVAVSPVDVEFARLRLTDPSGEGRDVYSISGKDLPKGLVLTLVIGRKSKPEVLRLVIDDRDKQSAFPLIPNVQYDKTK